MSPSIALRQKTRAEFDAAIDWYEGREAGLGAEFADRIQAVFDRIAANARDSRHDLSGHSQGPRPPIPVLGLLSDPG